jgi:hypothetical protein
MALDSLDALPLHGYKEDPSNPALLRAARLAQEGQLFETDGMPKSQVDQYASVFKEVGVGRSWPLGLYDKSL